MSESSENREVLQQVNSDYQAAFELNNTETSRVFSITTTAPFQRKIYDNNQRIAYDNYLSQPRQINESSDASESTLEGNQITVYPTVNSNHIWFDTLYALAIEEVRQCSHPIVSDGSYQNGDAIGEGTIGGFFQTGLFWTYVWTRDISYSIDLGLANINPLRSLNSLKFKLSERRGGGDLQIIQDTGTGGSYPISSDRVVWSLGSLALLKQLDPSTKSEFSQDSYEALKNTIEHDRSVIFDQSDGLYRGEQSFLDWREQSYPRWTKCDPVQIGMSKALSTNCCHFHALQLAASLAGELGDTDAQEKYSQWAQQLKQAINDHLYLEDQHLYSTFITSTFAPGAAHQYDSLGNALAILLDIADEEQAEEIVAHYPHFPLGPSVIWPQQRDTLIYHNHAMWPFVTAYWLKAAKKVKNAQAVTLGISSLVRGAALSLSNMENFDVVTGRVEIESENKEPVINSPRQLWSVAGYVSMIHDIIFGISWTDTGLNIEPYITREFRHHLLPNSNQLVLNNLSYRGHIIDIILNLPPVTEEMSGSYVVETISLNNNQITSEILESMLSDRNTIEVNLGEGITEQSDIERVTNLDNYQYRFAPRPPIITSIDLVNNQLQINFNINSENPDEVRINIYRNGELVARDLEGSRTSWQDENSQGSDSPSYCYNLEAVYISSGLISQRSAPFCYWGSNPDYNRIYSINAEQFSVFGGDFTFNYGRNHYQNWGAPDHSITVEFTPEVSGHYAIQVVAGNGFGTTDTGITCGVKRLKMKLKETDSSDENDEQNVASGYLIMPHLRERKDNINYWDRWLESSVIFTNSELMAGTTYKITIDQDDKAINMSHFVHNQNYTGGYQGNGGENGPLNYVNIAEIKLARL